MTTEGRKSWRRQAWETLGMSGALALLWTWYHWNT